MLGVPALPSGAAATERDGLAPGTRDGEVPLSDAQGGLGNAHYTLALADRRVRSSVVRLPPATHGNGDNGFIPAAIGFARQKGAAADVGDGANRWPAVHRDDAARLFRLALDSAPAGSVLHWAHSSCPRPRAPPGFGAAVVMACRHRPTPGGATCGSEVGSPPISISPEV
jgi:nucleoside-diphosphate-sugar epimerase